MFSQRIVGDESFLEMPLSSQCLYFHLGVYADDDGFVNPQKIIRMTGSNPDDLKVLITKNFVIPLDGGVVVVTHWRENNYIQKDRYTPTIYQEQNEKLSCIQNVYRLDTQVRLGKVRVELGKGRLGGGDESPTPSEVMRNWLASEENQKQTAAYLTSKGVPADVSLAEVKKFVSYWTEPNKSGTKQRWELEKVFDLQRRLQTWLNNVSKFTHNNTPKIRSL